ncbi:hypothetical protein [Sphingomonas sp.]|uniref:hypothetical protein n=1 Tax=Sphingomonas sp. TaxID=28214 RepID=UPI001796BCEB|nr:hypothetical protein [Sphingomonas sp.]MBA4763651.1 hypothetical protein [Sphingomonas sp.]
MAYSGVRARGLGCVVGVLVVFLASTITYGFMTGYLPVRPFDSDRWKRVERVDDQARIHMIEHLMWSGKLDGLSRSELVALLGAPLKAGYFRDRDYVYWLGNERSLFSIDSEWLVVDVDASGRVSHYEVVRD